MLCKSNSVSTLQHVILHYYRLHSWIPKVIDDFVGCNRELRYLELDESEWDTIAQVADWLRLFHLATTQMSKTKESSMLSTMHAIFQGLQDHIIDIFRNLPDSTPQTMKSRLLDAHCKLGNYYYKSNQLPLYTYMVHLWVLCLFLHVWPWPCFSAWSTYILQWGHSLWA